MALQFKPITKEDLSTLRGYYSGCSYGLCEYAAGTKYMWRGELNPSWTETAGCLVMRNDIKGRVVFDYPVAGPEGDEDAALTAIECWCLERGIAPVVSVVPAVRADALLRRYPYVRVSNIRTWKDYVYRTEDLQNFAGRHYAGQRNHVRKLRARCPDAFFRPLTAQDGALLAAFRADYEQEFGKGDNPRAVQELESAWEMLEMAGAPYFRCGGLFDGARLIAVSLAELCGDTLVIHIEKALYSYEGVYPTLVQEFARAFGADAAYLNREDDAADRGLRTSKLQYGPTALSPKYCFEPQNELLTHVREIPELQTARLTLTALREEDIPAYNALVLDKERNRWWGYDDVAGLGAAVEYDSFYRVARRDFENRAAVNFAVRLDGKLIGEAVLYRFNYRGDAELGCRIAREYEGAGYGAEAFAAVADWGLYRVHLNRVVAKCYRENEASRRMLAGCMRPSGEDETFYYFTKEV